MASFGRVQAESVGNDFRHAGHVNGENLVCGFARAWVRDLWGHRDLEEFNSSVNVSVDANGAAMLKITPIWTRLKNDDEESSPAASAAAAVAGRGCGRGRGAAPHGKGRVWRAWSVFGG